MPKPRRVDPPTVPVAAPRPTASAVAVDVARHVLPLVPLYLGSGSIPAYLVATAYDLALGVVLIVGTTRAPDDPTTVDPRATSLGARLAAILVLAVFFALVAAFLAFPIALPVVMSGWATGVDWRAVASEPTFRAAVVAMPLAAAVRAQWQFEAVTTPGAIGTAPRAAPVVGDLDADRREARAGTRRRSRSSRPSSRSPTRSSSSAVPVRSCCRSRMPRPSSRTTRVPTSRGASCRRSGPTLGLVEDREVETVGKRHDSRHGRYSQCLNGPA